MAMAGGAGPDGADMMAGATAVVDMMSELVRLMGIEICKCFIFSMASSIAAPRLLILFTVAGAISWCSAMKLLSRSLRRGSSASL